MTLAGCGQGSKSRLKDFSPAGTWTFKNSQFVFEEDGHFRREVLGPNPEQYAWKGEWRREGDTIRAKYTEAKNDVGEEVAFEIRDENFMLAPDWGLFQRARSKREDER